MSLRTYDPPSPAFVRLPRTFALGQEAAAAELPRAKHYPAGVELFRQGDPAEDVLYLERGLVKLLRSHADGAEVIVGLRRAPWFLASSSAVLEEPYAATAVTLVACVASRVPARHFRAWVRSHPEVSWTLHRMHSREVYDQLVQVGELASSSARQRLQRFLAGLLPPGSYAGQEVRVAVGLRCWEIAQLLAITPQYLSVLFGEFEQDGLIRREKDALVVCDPERLT